MYYAIFWQTDSNDLPAFMQVCARAKRKGEAPEASQEGTEGDGLWVYFKILGGTDTNRK